MAEAGDAVEGSSYTVMMTTRQWQVIDGTIDNEVDTAVMNGDPQGVSGLGQRVRQAGWDQIVGSAEGWPPDDAVITITLTRSQWALVVEVLNRWAQVAELVGHGDEAQFGRHIRSLVMAQLETLSVVSF